MHGDLWIGKFKEYHKCMSLVLMTCGKSGLAQGPAS